MNTFDAMLCAIVANPTDDTPKLALMDFCREELNSKELAELVECKMGLLKYPPLQSMRWEPNPKQAAVDLRNQIRYTEDMLLEDGLDYYHIGINEAFFLVAFLTRRSKWERYQGDHSNETSVRCREMLTQTQALKLEAKHEEERFMRPSELDDDDPFEDNEDEDGEMDDLPQIMFRGVPVQTTRHLEQHFNFVTRNRRRNFVHGQPPT